MHWSSRGMTTAGSSIRPPTSSPITSASPSSPAPRRKSSATRPAVPRVSITPPDVERVRRVLEAAHASDPLLACWLEVAVATGARRGEVCALRWCDIDLDNATARIERSVCATRAEGVVVKTTKTDRSRLVSLTPRAVAVLVRRYGDMTRCAPVDRQDLVFHHGSDPRQPWRPELITRRWERLRTKVGCRDVRIHDLRHFVATELLTAGIDVRTVSNRLGHARTSTTLDIYWAWVPARDRDAADHLQAVLASAGD